MPDPTEIHNWRRLDDCVTTSGQSTQAQLGIEHVINLGLHTHEKALPDEAVTLANLGMVYVHIPVAFDQPTQEDFLSSATHWQRLATSRFTSIVSPI